MYTWEVRIDQNNFKNFYFYFFCLHLVESFICGMQTRGSNASSTISTLFIYRSNRGALLSWYRTNGNIYCDRHYYWPGTQQILFIDIIIDQVLKRFYSSTLLLTRYSRHSVNGPSVTGNIQLTDFLSVNWMPFGYWTKSLLTEWSNNP